MGTNRNLKHLFEGLQKQESPSAKSTESKIIELSSSDKYLLHQAISNCTDSHEFNWKKLYRQHFQRPSIEQSSDPVIQDTQWKIQALSESPLLISFHYTDCLVPSLKKLNTYMTVRPSFWKHLLLGAGQIHLRSAKNKIQVWIRFSDFTNENQKMLKATLENEFMENSTQLKSFSLQKVEEWFELGFDINEKIAESRDKDVSV
jgi:hypothetical protein